MLTNVMALTALVQALLLFTAIRLLSWVSLWVAAAREGRGIHRILHAA